MVRGRFVSGYILLFRELIVLRGVQGFIGIIRLQIILFNLFVIRFSIVNNLLSHIIFRNVKLCSLLCSQIVSGFGLGKPVVSVLVMVDNFFRSVVAFHVGQLVVEFGFLLDWGFG